MEEQADINNYKDFRAAIKDSLIGRLPLAVKQVLNFGKPNQAKDISSLSQRFSRMEIQDGKLFAIHHKGITAPGNLTITYHDGASITDEINVAAWCCYASCVGWGKLFVGYTCDSAGAGNSQVLYRTTTTPYTTLITYTPTTYILALKFFNGKLYIMRAIQDGVTNIGTVFIDEYDFYTAATTVVGSVSFINADFSGDGMYLNDFVIAEDNSKIYALVNIATTDLVGAVNPVSVILKSTNGAIWTEIKRTTYTGATLSTTNRETNIQKITHYEDKLIYFTNLAAYSSDDDSTFTEIFRMTNAVINFPSNYISDNSFFYPFIYDGTLYVIHCSDNDANLYYYTNGTFKLITDLPDLNGWIGSVKFYNGAFFIAGEDVLWEMKDVTQTEDPKSWQASAPATVACGAAATLILAANPLRKWAIIQPTTGNIFVRFDNAAATGIWVTQWQKIHINNYVGAVYGIRDGAVDVTALYVEGT